MLNIRHGDFLMAFSKEKTVRITITKELFSFYEKKLKLKVNTVVPSDHPMAKNCDIFFGYAEKALIKENYPNLKMIQLASAGYDKIDLEQLKKDEVKLANARGIYSVAIAEYVFAYILKSLKDLDHLEKLQLSQTWDKTTYQPKLLQHQVVYLLGTGSISQEIAKRLKAFGTRVIGFNSNGRSIPNFDRSYPLDMMQSILKDADILISALPDNQASHHLFNDYTCSLMKADAIFINVGRGSLIDEKASQGSFKHLRSVILDVFEVEPLDKDSYLWREDNVYVTPHISFLSTENTENLLKLLLENMENLKNDQSLTNQIL